MPISASETRTALLKCGKEEFLKRGFKKASLRAICSKANLTTGAFYTHFKTKDEFFCAIVEDDLHEYNGLYDGLIDRVVGRVSSSQGEERKIMEFIMDHRALFCLLFDCSDGSSYEGFKDDLLRKFDITYQRFFDSYAAKPVDPALVRTVVRMKFAQYCEMIYGDFDRDEVMRITDSLAEFTRAGFEALLGTKFESPGYVPGLFS